MAHPQSGTSCVLVRPSIPLGSERVNFPAAVEPPRFGGPAWPGGLPQGVLGDIVCGFCGKHVGKGTRYKCLQCFGYERCSECMSAPKAWASHDSTHQFFPIRNPEDATHFSEVKMMVQRPVSIRPPRFTHLGIICDGCDQPDIEGVRHKCLICSDYDLCERCIASPIKRTQHDSNHAFFPMSTPRDREDYNRTRAAAGPECVPHNGVYCDGCNSNNPIVGTRHKCLDCQDFDLCTQCMSNPLRRLQHDATHAFFPIDVPGDKTYFTIAQEQRRAVASPQHSGSETVLFNIQGSLSN